MYVCMYVMHVCCSSEIRSPHIKELAPIEYFRWLDTNCLNSHAVNSFRWKHNNSKEVKCANLKGSSRVRTTNPSLCMYACKYVMQICMYVCMHGCKHVCVHICMFVCMYVCTYVCCPSETRSPQQGADNALNDPDGPRRIRGSHAP